jgi:hypothetical protein
MKWIAESAKKGRNLKDMYNLSGVDVYIKDRTPDNVDDDFVFNYVSARIPFHLTTGIDIIYVGTFPEMIDREINAFYESGAIYVTNDQEDEMDMIDDIIHELAHAVETNNQEIIYGNGKLQREFKIKRRKLFSILEEMYDVPKDFLNDIEYNEQIDDFLYKKVGYDILNQMVINIFVSGYAATSISEYFARGFEEYFVGKKDELKRISPILFSVIEELVNLED